MTALRPVFLMLLVVLNAAALVFFLLGEPSWEDASWALFLVVVFTPMKGITYRRLGGVRPYLAAILATLTWQAIGLPIDLDSFWTIMAASMAVSLAIDFLALLAMETAPTVARCSFLALYGSLVVHFLTIGFFLFQRNAAYGLPVLAAGIGLFLLPAFYTDLFTSEQP